MRYSFSTPKEIARGLKYTWESKMGAPSLARIIQDVDIALKTLEIVNHANGASVEGLADRIGHRRKVLGEGKSVSWGCPRTKGKGRECELTKEMFLHSDLLKLCMKKNTTSLIFSLSQLFLTIRKILLRTNKIKI